MHWWATGHIQYPRRFLRPEDYYYKVSEKRILIHDIVLLFPENLLPNSNIIRLHYIDSHNFRIIKNPAFLQGLYGIILIPGELIFKRIDWMPFYRLVFFWIFRLLQVLNLKKEVDWYRIFLVVFEKIWIRFFQWILDIWLMFVEHQSTSGTKIYCLYPCTREAILYYSSSEFTVVHRRITNTKCL